MLKALKVNLSSLDVFGKVLEQKPKQKRTNITN
jgi:hypothetical protein